MAFEISYFHERVLSEIQSWPVEVLADYARLVELLAAHGPSLRLPHSRAFYCFMVDQRVVILHAFIKKSQQTPDSELKIARKRLKEVQQHG
jgi:hypothetical protein